jgi:hypothetical protein
MFDVNGDGRLSAVGDVLLVINRINNPGGVGEGEGESSEARPALAQPQLPVGDPVGTPDPLAQQSLDIDPAAAAASLDPEPIAPWQPAVPGPAVPIPPVEPARLQQLLWDVFEEEDDRLWEPLLEQLAVAWLEAENLQRSSPTG